jgi:PAS domain S-box-containing protein
MESQSSARVEIENSDDQLRTIIETIPTQAWSARSDGSADFLNKRWLEYTGLSADQALDWGWKAAIDPDHLPNPFSKPYAEFA